MTSRRAEAMAGRSASAKMEAPEPTRRESGVEVVTRAAGFCGVGGRSVAWGWEVRVWSHGWRKESGRSIVVWLRGHLSGEMDGADDEPDAGWRCIKAP